MSNVIVTILANLDGRKTYICTVLIALVNLAIAFGVVSVTPDQIIAINGVLGAVGIGFLRAGVSKV